MQSAENEGEASARLSLSAIVLVACGFCPSATWKTKFGDNLTRLPRGVKVGDTVTHPLATWSYRFGDILSPLATWNKDEDAANDRLSPTITKERADWTFISCYEGEGRMRLGT